MNYTVINDCLKILNERPYWFLKKGNIADKLQCFETIQQIGTPIAINWIISFLRSDNSLIQGKAAETVLVLFSKLSLNEYADALKHLNIDKSDLDDYRAQFDGRTYLQLLVLASFNGNGYVREKAVNELARLKNTDGLKFILLRLGDWVAEVRKAANEAILTYLDDAYIVDLLKQLPTIDRLLKIKRVDLTEVHKRIIQFIVNQDFTTDLYNKIRRLDDKVRFRFYKNFLASKNPSKEQINRIIADRSFLVRIELLKHLKQYEPATQKELLEVLLQDQSAAVRQGALYASKEFSPQFDQQIALLLSDEAASVRELSRHLLKDEGLDYPQLYRQRIAKKQFLPGSLLGLSETGSHADIGIFEQNVHSEKNKLLLASLIAIHKFSPDKAKSFAEDLLTHKSKKVRIKAIEILSKNYDNETLQRARAIYIAGDFEIRKTLFMLFSKIGGWSIIGDLLLALNDENVELQNLAWTLLDKWKIRATTLFTTPPIAELQRATQIYSNLDLSKLNLTPRRTILLQDIKFYLR